jgi:hypothetical protein
MVHAWSKQMQHSSVSLTCARYDPSVIHPMAKDANIIHSMC